MPQFKYTGGYSAYYPDSGLFTKPGEVHTLDSAPDNRWEPVNGAQSDAAAPVVASPVTDTPEPAQAVETASPAADVIAEAEALIDANPALAAQIVKEAKANA